ncbi:uncharacterized protein LOC118780405 [Megalops cyprinoides]|uniref:uncharacterized protein LOC118780405 n=1 Tax=Megalops cyprinoides TaxID=118141 RepID=UPI001863BEFE|nr:uncharacterized protein LOC118780405 [Megalops cyprinoides]
MVQRWKGASYKIPKPVITQESPSGEIYTGERVTLSSRPQAVLILETGWTEIFTTDSLILRCEIQGISAEWNYTWYRDGEQIPLDHTGDIYTVRSGNGSYQSEYKCRGNRKKRPLFSNISEGLTPNTIRFYYILGLSGALVMLITIVVLEVICVKKCRKSGQTKKQLNKDKFYSKVNPEYVSSDHTLLSEALYEEIEDATEKQGSQAQASVYSVVQLENLDKESDSGEYICWGERGQNPTSQSFSGSLRINISGKRPKPIIIQESPSGEIYTGERVTLSCEFGGDPAGWEYLWYKDTQGAAQLILQSGWSEVFPTERVTLRCEIEGSSTEWMYKWYRNGKELPVDKEAPIGEIYTGEGVTLSCGFGGDPVGWEYLWYKDTQGAALPNTDSSRTDGSSYTISSAALSHSGEYWCRAGRGREVFQSQDSDSLMLNISSKAD